MISPYKFQKKGTAGASPRTAVPLRGLFLDGVWRCNCPERPPAIKLETKNRGVNHGRWFYTCQRPQQERCNFFLWETDAQTREKLVVLSNSRSESSETPRTPTKTAASTTTRPQASSGLLTPQTSERNPAQSTTRFKTPPTSAKARMMAEDTDEFEWDDSIGTEMEKLFDTSSPAPMRQPDFGLPRKTPRTKTITSPGKRKRSDLEEEEDDNNQSTNLNSQSVTLTPSSITTPGTGTGRAGPLLTPTPGKYRDAVAGAAESPLGSASDLVLQFSQILESHDVVVPGAARDELKELCNRYDLKLRGIIRGRDISRVALRKKDEQIARLNERVANLESQRELNPSVMGGLKK